MAAYQADDYVDLVNTTLRHLERNTWADIVVDNQRHIALPMILRKKKVEFGSGYGHQFNARFFSNDAAKNVKLNATDNPTTADTQKTGNVPWRHSETHWALEERIISMNRKPSRLVSLLKTSRVDAMTSLAELMETNFWSKPTDSSDELQPYGVPYWIVKNSSTGFNGGNPSGFSDGAGNLSSSTYTRWKNWTAAYTQVTKQDLIRKWREAATKTDFRPPVDGPFSNVAYKGSGSGKNSGYNESRSSQCMYFTTYAVLQPLEEILESQNDNLGNDVASKDGMVHFRRLPVIWVPWLDNNDSSNPIYGINFKLFKVAFLSGEYMKETKVKPHPLHHRTIVQYTDCSYNFFCNDRRGNFVLYVV